VPTFAVEADVEAELAREDRPAQRAGSAPRAIRSFFGAGNLGKGTPSEAVPFHSARVVISERTAMEGKLVPFLLRIPLQGSM
jgi:hypothetical protein